MDIETIKLIPRPQTGKGVSRKLRAKGMIPAIVYGPTTEPMPVAANLKEVEKIAARTEEKKYVHLIVEDHSGRTWEGTSLLKDFSVHPVERKILHADFYVIDKGRKITVDVPIKLNGEAEGVLAGGELQQFKRKVRITCLPDKLPAKIEVDISKLKVGASIRVEDLPVPEGVVIRERGDQSVVYIAPTRATLKSAES
ncbi:MAG: 50S ribosomal protein L25 [Syntrophales bacterium]|nr:50S ribosomal protein L25 [Syntrophales bacterium]